MPKKPLSAFDLLNKAIEHGISLVQYGDNLPLHQLAPEELRRLHNRAQREGIRLEVGTRGLTERIILRYVHIAETLEAKVLRIVSDLPGYEPSPQEIADIVRQILPALERTGVTLAVENHDRLQVSQLRSLIESVGHPLLGICLDMVNSLGAGEGLEAVLNTLLPVTKNLHIKDFTIKRLWHQMGFVVEGCPAGQGFIDIPRVLERVAQHCPSSSAILELWTPPLSTTEETLVREEAWVAQSLDYLRPLLP